MVSTIRLSSCLFSIRQMGGGAFHGHRLYPSPAGLQRKRDWGPFGFTVLCGESPGDAYAAAGKTSGIDAVIYKLMDFDVLVKSLGL
jgi:hypothetical protein